MKGLDLVITYGDNITVCSRGSILPGAGVPEQWLSEDHLIELVGRAKMPSLILSLAVCGCNVSNTNRRNDGRARRGEHGEAI